MKHKPRATYVAFRKLEDAKRWARDFAKSGIYAVVRRAKRCGSAYRPWEVKVILEW